MPSGPLTCWWWGAVEKRLRQNQTAKTELRALLCPLCSAALSRAALVPARLGLGGLRSDTCLPSALRGVSNESGSTTWVWGSHRAWPRNRLLW